MLHRALSVCRASLTASFTSSPLLWICCTEESAAACGTAISRRYPAVEILTALLSALTAWHFGLGLEGVAALAFVYFLIALGFIDAHTQLLPDSLTLPLLWLGLLVNLDDAFVPLNDAVIGAAAGYLVLWTIYWIFRLVTGKEGMGYGDFKLLAALGAWLGWQALPLILVLASCVGALVGITMVLLRKQSKDQTIPFGPYLALGGVLMLLYGNRNALLCWCTIFFTSFQAISLPS